MAYSQISGNDNLIEKLKMIALSESIHHAYIFEGPLNSGKLSIAVSFAQALLCREEPGIGCGRCAVCRKIASDNHVDIIRVSASSSKTSSVLSVKDADIEELITRLKAKPYEADRNIAIIENADSMSRKAANRLLKTLEEPPVGTVIMILSENITNLPVTIRSRCVHMRVLADLTKSDEFAEISAKLVDQFSRRENYTQVKKTIDRIGKERESAYLFLDSLEEEYRSRLLDIDSGIKREVIFSAVDEIEKTRKRLKGNVTVQYALKALVLTLGG